MRVKVSWQGEEFEGELVRGDFEVNKHVPAVSVVRVDVPTVRVVPADSVRPVDSPEAARYRAHWATLTGRAPADIYIPLAIR